ncbi:MAG: zf-HC2 domain-containing protein [Firmicutes bacterium]|nr:zf-HC2 domain-containing protein [Bacillota bacterium]
MNNKQRPDCDSCKRMLIDYASGNLDEENSNRVQKHLNLCRDCQNIFEQYENEEFLKGNGTDFSFSKLKIKFISKVILICILSLIIFCLILGIFLPALFNLVLGHRNQIAERVFADYIMFTIPSAQIESFGSSQEIMSLKINSKYSQNPFSPSNEISLTIPTFFLKAYSSYVMNSPGICFNETKLGSSEENNLEWNKLAKISQFTNCQAVIRFSNPISTAELETFLEEINGNNRYAWAAIDTGNIEIKPIKHTFNSSWGFPQSMQKVNGAGSVITEDSIVRAAQDFRIEMHFLENEGKYLGNNKLLKEVKEINQYIDNNGIKIIGVVVVIRSNDLLKYKDNQLISSIDVVKAELDY